MRNNITAIMSRRSPVYDERTISVSLPEAKIYAPAIAGGIQPSQPEFYADYGPDYDERYQWRFPPTTGAYEVLPEDIVKGLFHHPDAREGLVGQGPEVLQTPLQPGQDRPHRGPRRVEGLRTCSAPANWTPSSSPCRNYGMRNPR
jgi:hypothetical protein